jgi:hypothetical protein
MAKIKLISIEGHAGEHSDMPKKPKTQNPSKT